MDSAITDYIDNAPEEQREDPRYLAGLATRKKGVMFHLMNNAGLADVCKCGGC